MKIEIGIATKDRGLSSSILNHPKMFTAGQTKVEIPGGGALVWEGEEMAKAGVDLPRVVQFSLEVGAGVASGLIVNWLWDRLKGKQVTAITMDRTTVEFTEGEIKRVVQEKISAKK
jgi:hypothetical protein